MLVDCLVSKPPKKADYLAADEKERERLLSEFAKKQTHNLLACNKRLLESRKWKEAQLVRFGNKEGENGDSR